MTQFIPDLLTVPRRKGTTGALVLHKEKLRVLLRVSSRQEQVLSHAHNLAGCKYLDRLLGPSGEIGQREYPANSESFIPSEPRFPAPCNSGVVDCSAVCMCVCVCSCV